MASNLPVPAGGFLPAELPRRTGRELRRLDERSVLARHSDSLRVQRVTDAASHAQASVAYLSGLELAHVQSCENPLAEGRLRHITDTAVLGLASVVWDAGQSW